MWWKKIGARMMCIAVILVVFVATIWDFSLQLQGELTRETYQTLSEVSEDYNRAFLDRVSYNIKAMKVLAGGLKEMSGRTKQDIMRVLQNAVDDGGFEKMVVCDVNGISCSNNGISGDISHREYFQKAMQGKTNISEPITSIIDGEKSIVMAVPIHDEKSTTGVLFGVYPLLVGGMQLTDFSYYSEGYGFIVASDGTVLLSGEHTDKLANEENLFSFFEKTEISGFSVAEIKTAMENKESKSFKFKYDGERRFVSFTPSTVNDWYTFSIASDVMLQQQKSVTNKMVTRLILRVALIGAILLLWIFMRNRRHNKEILLANHKYQSLLSHINGGMI
ncbi:MAG: cache domain-containing protein, partial [Oscillospiraceae bacterium]